MSSVEPEVRDFLVKIATSISVVLLWMLVNCSVGIGLGYGFFDNKPTTGNYIFYAWFLLSMFALGRYLYKKWKF